MGRHNRGMHRRLSSVRGAPVTAVVMPPPVAAAAALVPPVPAGVQRKARVVCNNSQHIAL